MARVDIFPRVVTNLLAAPTIAIIKSSRFSASASRADLDTAIPKHPQSNFSSPSIAHNAMPEKTISNSIAKTELFELPYPVRRLAPKYNSIIMTAAARAKEIADSNGVRSKPKVDIMDSVCLPKRTRS